jgi:hypothetical protein
MPRTLQQLCIPEANSASICIAGDTFILKKLRERFPERVLVDHAPKLEEFSYKKVGNARKRVTAAGRRACM